MIVRFLLPARREFDDAVREYAAKRAGLGREFSEAIAAAFVRINAYPDAWGLIGGNIRRYVASRFPYAIIYRREAAEIVIIAIAHHRREPNYWYSRQ